MAHKETTSAPGENAKGRAWRYEKRATGPWLGSKNPQLDRYLAATAAPTARNRGPKGRGQAPWVKYRFVTLDVTAEQALAMSGGRLVAPEGCTALKNLELAGPFFVMRQAKKKLARWRVRYPNATLLGWDMVKRPDRWPVSVYGVRQWVSESPCSGAA